MRKWKNKSILLRYMGSFLIVLLLPMFFLCTFFLHSLNNLLAGQTQEMKKVYFEEASEQITELLNGIVDRAYQMSQNDTFGRYRLTDQIRYGKSIINELNSSRQICEIADDICIYSPTLDFAYSSTSTYTRERFVRLITDNTMDEQAYHNFLINMDLRNGCPYYTDKYIYIYFNLPTYTFQSDVYLIFKLNPGLLGNKLTNGQKQAGSGYGIFGRNNMLLFHDGIMTEKVNDDLQEILSSETADTSFPLSGVLNDNGEKYDVFIDYYPVTDFYYYSLSPQNAMVSLVTQRQSITYLVIFIVFLCGNLLCLLFTYVSYKPIKRLNTKAEAVLDFLEKEGGSTAAGTKNELDIIQTALHSLQSSLEAFTVSGDIRDKAIKQFLISSLLLGRANNPSAVSNGLLQLGISADTEFVLAGIFYLIDRTGSGKEQVTQEYLTFLENSSKEGITLYAIAGKETNQIDLMLTLDKDDIRFYQSFFTELQNQFTQCFGITATIGFGTIYPELSLVSISYMQATQKIRGRSLKDDGKILYHLGENEGSRFYQQIRNYFPRFRSAVRECIPEQSLLLLQKMETAIIESDMQISEVQFLLACILEVLVSAFYNYDFEIDSSFYSRYQMNNIEKITTQEMLRTFIECLATDMCSIMKDELLMKEENRKKRQESLSIVERIQDYIDNNLKNQQLSITGMSHEFGVSASYLCRIYKEKYGVTVLEYINTKRIELAKCLLVETDLTVDAIVKEIGFVNSSSFIRKFSGVVGLTPGKYRETQLRLQ